MSEDSNCEISPAGPSSTPAVASTTLEPRAVMSSYMKQLLAEKQKLEDKAGPELQLTHKLLANELERLQNGGRPLHNNSSGNRASTEDRRFADIIKEKPLKVTIRVLVPVKEHPKFNFVGKLLGPKGNSLKRLQEDTMTKMAILGRGSMRDKHKEEELRCSGDPKFSHLSDDLHIEITAFAPPAEAHARIAYALAEVRRFLVPDYNDEIRQEQMWEIQVMNTQRSGKGELPVGDSTASSSSTGSMSPCTPPLPVAAESPPPHPAMHGLVLATQHPALRGLEPRTSIAAANVTSVGAASGPPTQLVCRKRPLLPGGSNRLAMSPTKRTVLSILARARAAQAKDLSEYHHVSNGRNTGIPAMREDSIPGGNLV